MDARGWDERYAADDLVWSAGPNRFVEEVCADIPPGRAIDLAAGEGRNALWLASRGWAVTAVDFSAVGVERARRLARERGLDLVTEVADLTEYVPTPGGYDLVVIAYLHIPESEWRRVVARAAAGVAPGGRLVVVGHDRSNLDDGHGGPQDPDVLTTTDATLDAIGRALTVERAEVVDRPVETDDGPRVAKDTLVVASRRT